MGDGDQKLEVIRKLLAKAEKAATPEEASAYNAKAAQMMARHGVDEAMLAATGVKQDALGERRIAVDDPYSQEKAQLAGLIGRALGCRAVRHPGYGRGQIIAITIFGYESDLQRTEVLFTSLLLQATRQVVHQRPPAWTGESTAAFRRTWLTGFGTEIYRRLTLAERAATEQHDAASVTRGPSAALVLADRRTVVKKAFEERFANLQKGRNRRLSGSGYGAGIAAGRRADVGGPRLGGARGQLGASSD